MNKSFENMSFLPSNHHFVGLSHCVSFTVSCLECEMCSNPTTEHINSPCFTATRNNQLLLTLAVSSQLPKLFYFFKTSSY